MGLFRKARKKDPVFQATPDDLARIGYGSYGGDTPYPAGLRPHELDGYAMAALESAGYPAHGTPQYAALVDRFLTEGAAIGAHAPPWGVVGAFCVATNFADAETRSNHPTFLQVTDDALTVLRDDGVAYTAIPPFALDRWQQVHGLDGIRPARWPSALENLSLPSVGAEPPVDDLAPDESRAVARDGPDGNSRTTFAQRRADGRVVAIVDGVDVSDGERKRWELGVEAESYPAFLRALGDRLVTQTWWAHDDLVPYFPCRARSRTEMRHLAHQLTLGT